ncbi:MAG TPA: hypothetical protein VFT98_06800, partial [Myxococcota bacterium]|nr:hypothetical protein [Myxococcota bacterium]
APDAAASDEAAALEGASGDPEQAAAPPVTPQPAPAPIRVVQRDKSWIDWLLEPVVLAGLAVLMLGLVVILWRRSPPRPAAKPTRKEDETSTASLFASEPAASSPESQRDAAAVETIPSPFASEAGGPADGAGDTGESPFDLEAPDTEPEKPDPGPAHGAMLSTIASVTSTSAFETQAPTSTGGLSLSELDRRLALLEQRLEEVIDAKDRLERQVSAQTEELRVQRAAIARTQRVLRTVVRPEDDQPSEPALKS